MCDFHARVVNPHWHHAEDDCGIKWCVCVSGHGSEGGCERFQTERRVWTYSGVEVGHFGNTCSIILPTGIGGVQILPNGSGIKCKVHKWTRDIELLVDDL